MRGIGSDLGRADGFTLIELLMVVVLIGVLATMGAPTFMKMMLRARRAEAVNTLHAIYESQTDYYAENGRYADTFDDLGFRLEASSLSDPQTLVGRYYTYSLSALDQGGLPGGNYRALAVTDLDGGDPVLDVIMIENQLSVAGI